MTVRADARRLGEIVGGKYRVVRFLAAGGMGVVYEAQHTVVKRRFAVKFLHPDLADQRDSLTRFQREAQTAGALESENVTAAVDFGIVADGSPYIVMEYLVGESLESLLEREERLPLERAADLVLQACRGIQAAHASGIVHRDLKPQNLFVCRREDGTDLLKVLDFGIAKLETIDANSTATRTGTVLGTPAYMSPEQARGEKAIDHRTDVYALGAILYECLSGQKPHPGDSHNAVLHHISTQPAVPLESVQLGLPAALVEVVERALASDPQARPASAEVFGQALAAFGRREVWPAAKSDEPLPGAGEPSATLLAPGNSPRPIELARGALGRTDFDASPEPSPPSPRRRRSRALVAFVALGGGVALAAVAIATNGARRGAATSPQSSPTTAPAPLVATADAPVLTAAVQPALPALPATPTASIAVESAAHAQPVPALASAKTLVGRSAPAVPPAAPSSRSTPLGRPDGRPDGRPSELRASAAASSGSARAAAELPSAPELRPTQVTFDSKNPYN